ncbi:S8 family serine peptidase [Dyadobacter frigoris]|uniref:CUB domain-containing protein n=1 Tax=Dyadobacter frigoris TaxID=2576211 RepID=A0A4U6CSL6_9BACT|nr:S8 family serine peptidase [Dyadobacter frigoris]TKT86537.1 hypothetical protein FDK13_32170 [Dyadobacter frigoris]
MCKNLYLLVLLLASSVSAQTSQQYFAAGTRAYTLLHPRIISQKTTAKPVLVAVIDDAFSLTHNALSGYYFTNVKEIRNNLQDDDRNGYTDDFQGWDMADGDGKVSLPADKASANFLHGSMIAGVIIRTAEQTLGKVRARKNLRILPIKVISDAASIGNYDLGYEGMKYAVDMGADIICLPWSGGSFDQKYLAYFELARQKGILILASSGNFSSETVQKPGGLPGVHMVSAIDTIFIKLPSANYSREVDLSAVGQTVLAPYAANDSLYMYLEKTSAAVALVTGCAAVIKSLSPKMSPEEIMALLQNTATNIDKANPDYLGKLGSGVPDMSRVVDYLSEKNKKMTDYFDPERANGSVLISKNEGASNWKFDMARKDVEMVFSLTGDTRNLTSQFLDFTDIDKKSIKKISIIEFPDELRIQSGNFSVRLNGKLPTSPILLNYYTIPKDSATLYCREIVALNDSTGTFEDGSGEANYTGNCSCKWQITVAQGKNIRLDFTQFALEDIKDNVLIFKGNGTQQENMMARFSGDKLPPSLVIDGNQVLVWFITDRNHHDKGFKINYQATDASPGVVQ